MSKRKKILLGLILVVSSSIGAYVLEAMHKDLMTQTDMIMSNVNPECYVYFTDKDHSKIESANVAYYKSMVDEINKTGIKYLGSFLRSPAFTEWLFQNCPLYNGTHSIYQLTNYNSSLADINSRINPSPELLQQVKIEQQFNNYNYMQNPMNFSRIEYIAQYYNQTLQSTVDNLFLSGALNFENPNQCHNPSWRANSDIRQCSIYGSTFVVNLHNQDLMAILDKPIAGMKVS